MISTAVVKRLKWVREKAISPQWAGAGIALNAIAPGVIETPMTAEQLADEESRRLLAKGAPAPYNGPAGPSSAPAGLLRYLTSEDNTFVTGHSGVDQDASPVVFGRMSACEAVHEEQPVGVPWPIRLLGYRQMVEKESVRQSGLHSARQRCPARGTSTTDERWRNRS